MMLRVLLLLILPLYAVAAPLPVPDQGPALRIQGSNTIGAALGPALVMGMMQHQGVQAVHSELGDGANEQRVIGKTPPRQDGHHRGGGPWLQYRVRRAEKPQRRPRRVVAPDQGQRTGGP